jgi:hypothetical protein
MMMIVCIIFTLRLIDTEIKTRPLKKKISDDIVYMSSPSLTLPANLTYTINENIKEYAVSYGEDGAIHLCSKLYGVLDPVIITREKYDELTEKIEELQEEIERLKK